MVFLIKKPTNIYVCTFARGSIKEDLDTGSSVAKHLSCLSCPSLSQKSHLFYYI